MKVRRKITSIICLCTAVVCYMVLAYCGNSWAKEYIVKAAPKYCEHGLHFPPNGKAFAVMLFCEDAAGTHLGVIQYNSGLGLWALDNRFWQESDWAVDVISFAWSPGGNYLYISTSNIYGSGFLYELDLIKKEYKQIYPNKDDKALTRSIYKTEIVKVEPDDRYLEFLVEYFDTISKAHLKGSARVKRVVT